MGRVTMKALLPVTAPWLWPLVRWDGRWLEWYPGAVALELAGTRKGDLRRLRLHDGADLVQRLDHVSRIEDAYTYSIIAGPYPVTACLAQVRVLPHDGDGRATLVWTANFHPAGVSEEAAEEFIRRLYQTGFDTLSALLADGIGTSGPTVRAALAHGPKATNKGS